MDSEPIRKAVNIHLEAIEGLCDKKLSTLKERLEVLNSHLAELEGITADYLEESNLRRMMGYFLGAYKALSRRALFGDHYLRRIFSKNVTLSANSYTLTVFTMVCPTVLL